MSIIVQANKTVPLSRMNANNHLKDLINNTLLLPEQRMLHKRLGMTPHKCAIHINTPALMTPETVSRLSDVLGVSVPVLIAEYGCATGTITLKDAAFYGVAISVGKK